MIKNNIKQNKNHGFTLLFASLISALVLSIGLAILNVTLKQISLSIAGRESQQSFYSADAGTECALYFKQGAGITDCQSGVYYIPDPSGVPVAFCESAAVYDTFECLGQQIDLSYTTLGSGAVDNTFSVSTASNDDSNQDICFSVDVVKQSDGTTIIESRGYNVCGANGKYERAVLSRFDPVL